jgi:orotate phosphoribosyltransferase
VHPPSGECVPVLSDTSGRLLERSPVCVTRVEQSFTRPAQRVTRPGVRTLGGMTPREQLLALVREHAIVHGEVVLSSGRTAQYYVDLRRITLSGAAAPLVGTVMRELTADLEYDAVGGMTMAADPIATAMLHSAAADGLRLDAFVIRKEAKAHGLQRRIEGPDVAGRRVLVLEDTTTTGGTPLAALAAVREAGGLPVAVATLADRDTGAGARIEAEGVPYRYAYSLADLGLS